MRIFSVLLLSIALLFLPACSDDRDSGVAPPPADIPAGPSVTRSEAVLTADSYARIHWTMSPANQTGVSCGGGFTSNYPVGPRTGMGYKWGGWNDIDVFLEKIAEGYGTGTGGGTGVYDEYPIDCVVGTSCTGLVSRAWRLNEKYTLCYDDPDIPRKLCEIAADMNDVDFGNHDAGDLKKGDAFINVHHTILFVYESRDGTLFVIDSSYEGVRFRPISWEFLMDGGYKAIRYQDIVDDPDPPGTTSNPIPIDSDLFPFIHDGNTRDVVSMEFDRYSCDAASSQVGPEVIYQLELRSPGTLTFVVNDFKHEGIDNDIHLLRSLERIDGVRLATDCVSTGDGTMTQLLEAGSYYVVIDSSTDMPGEYRLFVDFQ